MKLNKSPQGLLSFLPSDLLSNFFVNFVEKIAQNRGFELRTRWVHKCREIFIHKLSLFLTLSLSLSLQCAHEMKMGVFTNKQAWVHF
jgi:hypothetical protein